MKVTNDEKYIDITEMQERNENNLWWNNLWDESSIPTSERPFEMNNSYVWYNCLSYIEIIVCDISSQ